VIQADDYYPFGYSIEETAYRYDAGEENKFLYNGKELQEDLGLDWYDYGARMYMPDIGRWGVIDPAADVLEMSTPFAYSLNNPINFIDLDGELPIFINGNTSTQRGDATYWDAQLLNTIKNSGIPNPGATENDWAMFVDGNLGATKPGTRSEGKLQKGGIAANAVPRIRAGKIAAKADFQKILSKLERDPDSGKIIEKIQIYTHSRGSAFGQGYTAALMEMIGEYADQFEDPSNVIQYSLNLAPHQSNSINAVKGVPTVGMSHDWDPLSGDDIKGAFNLETNNGVHSNASFTNEVKEFISSFLSNGSKVNQSTIDGFVEKMEEYGIKVEVSQ
jgi:RHS repeat-associated protein